MCTIYDACRRACIYHSVIYVSRHLSFNSQRMHNIVIKKRVKNMVQKIELHLIFKKFPFWLQYQTFATASAWDFLCGRGGMGGGRVVSLLMVSSGGGRETVCL